MTRKSLEKRLREQAAAEHRDFVIGLLVLSAAMVAVVCFSGPGFATADLMSLFQG